MWRINGLILIFFLGGCIVANENFGDLIIGTWYGSATETEMGLVRNVITFKENHHFRAESFFGSAKKPLVTEGGYEVIGQNLFAKKLNKGKPIPIEFGSGGNELIFYLPGEEPTKMMKKH